MNKKSPTTTVFSDGSTFDYEDGYKSNGAPVATRDRTEHPKIVKSHKIFTFSRVMGFLFSLIILAIPFSLVMLVLCQVQQNENDNAIKDGINASGQVEVVQSVGGGLLVRSPDGKVFKCDTSVVNDRTVTGEETSVGANSATTTTVGPTGFVFCAQGGPATFSIPVPHDPMDVFYVAPTKDK